MPNQSKESKHLDEDDLAVPGEQLEDDDNLRLEINLDRELWNRILDLNGNWSVVLSSC